MKRPIPTIHACALILGEAGVLIRGRSGAGKSALTLALIAAADREGRFARLVADDRVALRHENGALYGAPHPLIAGQIEQRGTGILTLPYAPETRLTHVVDLVETLPNGEETRGETLLEGVRLRHIELPIGQPAEAAAQSLLAKM